MMTVSKKDYVALVDGDILAYRAAFSCEEKEYTYIHLLGSEEPKSFRYVKDAKEYYGDKIKDYKREDKVFVHPPEWAIRYIRDTLKDIIKETSAYGYRIFLGGKDNFRDRVFKEYKAGRPPKPAHLEVVRDYMIDFHSATVVQGEEADDALGKAQTDSTVICSVDKDLLQIPGCHYNWVTKQWNFITEQEGNEWFWMQMLMGDNVDNIQGIRGVGPVAASSLVDMFDGNMAQVHSYVQMCYQEEFHSYKEYFRNCKLLYIRRDEEVTTATQIFREVG